MNFWKLSTLALVVALGCVIGRGVINSASAEPQPHMKVALNQLEQAKASLVQATADKGGHRAKAIELTEEAISQVKAGIDYANTHK